ncbi:TIGR03618 family F420-dependent PPOX class oxidoreductase [Tepidiforma sp.]|uniref:TIGR03618 family F420-dependent PPOX class oxidoreductase n=1 Tax=Tepidiforma sp. TaxID=2682230 RepID=UPI002ADE8839|nr:TIGR03618 family F420-dependent PPOX class oxidoreductase [Tepidiforma sp.]
MPARIPPTAAAFLEAATWPGVLTTLGPDGWPRASSVWFALREGCIVISTPAGRPKAANAAADRRVSFLVDTRERPYRGVAIEGLATVTPDPGAETVRAIGRRYLGDALPPEFEARIAAAERVVLVIEPVRVRTWGLG